MKKLLFLALLAGAEEQAEICECTDRLQVNFALVSHYTEKETRLAVKGAKQAIEDRKLQFHVESTPDSAYDEVDALRALDAAVEQNAILITTMPNEKFVPKIKAATKAGIPVYIIGGVMESLLSQVRQVGMVNYIGPDETLAAKEGAKRLIDGGATQVMCFHHDSSMKTIAHRCDTITQSFTDAVGSGSAAQKLVPMDSLESEATKALNNMPATGNLAFVVQNRQAFDIVNQVSKDRGSSQRVSILTYESSTNVRQAMRGSRQDQIMYMDHQYYLQGYLAYALSLSEKQSGQKFEVDIPTGPNVVSRADLDADDMRQTCRDAGYPVCKMDFTNAIGELETTRRGQYNYDEGAVSISEVVDGCPCFDRTTTQVRISSHCHISFRKSWPSMSAYRQLKLDMPGTLFDWDLHTTFDLPRSALQNHEAIDGTGPYQYVTLISEDAMKAANSKKLLDSLVEAGQDDVNLFFVMQYVDITTDYDTDMYNPVTFVGYTTYQGGSKVGLYLRNQGRKHVLGVNPWAGAANAWEWNLGLVDAFTGVKHPWVWPNDGDCSQQTGLYTVRHGFGIDGSPVTGRVTCSNWVSNAVAANFVPPIRDALLREPEIDSLMIIDVNSAQTPGIVGMIEELGRDVMYSPAQLTSAGIQMLQTKEVQFGLDDQLYLQHYGVALVAAVQHHTGEAPNMKFMDTTRVILAENPQYVDLARFQVCEAYGDNNGFKKDRDGMYYPLCDYAPCGGIQNPCTGHGVCLFPGGRIEGVCECEEGWIGDNCETQAICPPGFGMVYGSPCQQCAPGEFGSGEYMIQCQQCAEGFFQTASGSTKCNACPVGTWRETEDPAQPCPPCPAGSARKDQFKCELCDLGHYTDSPGNEKCLPCEQGQFGATKGLTSCTYCRSNLTTLEEGKDEEEDCECAPGEYFMPGKTMADDWCQPCGEGQVCRGGKICPELHGHKLTFPPCKDGFWAGATNVPQLPFFQFDDEVQPGCVVPARDAEDLCNAINANYTRGMYATGCDGWSYLNETSYSPNAVGGDMDYAMAQSTAVLGILQDGQTVAAPRWFTVLRRCEEPAMRPANRPAELKTGYWAHADEPDRVFWCRVTTTGSAFEDCQGGMPGRSCAAVRDPSYQACGMCRDGYYADPISRECLHCSESDSLWLILVVIAALMLFVIFHYYCNNPLTASTSSLLITSLACGQLIFSAQFLSILANIRLPFDEPMKTIMAFFDLIEFDISMLRADCMAKFDPVTNYLMVMLLPLFLILPFLCLHPISHYVVGSFLPRKFQMDFSRMCNTIGMFSQAAFILITLNAFVPLQCKANPNNGMFEQTSTIMKYPDITCWSPQHWKMFGISIVSILFYVIGFFSVCCSVLFRIWTRPRILNSKAFRTRWRWFMFRFAPEYWWFGSIMMCRNLLIALVPVFSPSSSIKQLVLLFLFTLCGVTITCRFYPWRTKALNRLDVITMFSYIVLLSCCYHPEQEEDLFVDVLMFFVLFFGLACIFGIAVISILSHFMSDWSYFKKKVKQDLDLAEKVSSSFERLFLYANKFHKNSAYALCDQLGMLDIEKIHYFLLLLDTELFNGKLECGMLRRLSFAPQGSSMAKDWEKGESQGNRSSFQVAGFDQKEAEESKPKNQGVSSQGDDKEPDLVAQPEVEDEDAC